MTNLLDVDELIKQLLKVKQTGKQVGELIYLIVTLYQVDLYFYHLNGRVTLLNVHQSIEDKVINRKNCRISEVHGCLVIFGVMIQKIKKKHNQRVHTQLGFACSRLTIETLEQGVKYGQS